jgi:hypothetical protein
MRKYGIVLLALSGVMGLTACNNQSAEELRQTELTQNSVAAADTEEVSNDETTEEEIVVKKGESEGNGEINTETVDPSYYSLDYIADEHFVDDKVFTADFPNEINYQKVSFTVTAVEAWTGEKASDGGDYFATLTDLFEVDRQFYLRDDEYSDDELEYLFYTLKIKNNSDEKALLNTTGITVYSRKEDPDNPYPEYGNKYIQEVAGDSFALDQSAYSEGNNKYYCILLDAGEEKTVTFAALLAKEEVGDGELYMIPYDVNLQTYASDGSGKYAPTTNSKTLFYHIPWRTKQAEE